MSLCQVLVLAFRILGAGLWLLTCIHPQFRIVGSAACLCEVGAFLIARFYATWGCRLLGCLGRWPFVLPFRSPVFSPFCQIWKPDRSRNLSSGRCYGRPLSRSGSRVRTPSPSPWKAGLLLYLCCVDASALHIVSTVGGLLMTSPVMLVQGVQLMAHGFHEGRPVFSTGSIPPAGSEADLCEVMPLGRSCNLLLPPSSRPRRQLAVFLGRPASEPPLLPCPIRMLADERLHGPALHRRILLTLGVEGARYTSISLQSPLPGLPAEQLLFLPPDLGWDDIILPVDLRPLGGSTCLVREQRSATCGQLLAAALEVQGRFRALHGGFRPMLYRLVLFRIPTPNTSWR